MNDPFLQFCSKCFDRQNIVYNLYFYLATKYYSYLQQNLGYLLQMLDDLKRY